MKTKYLGIAVIVTAVFFLMMPISQISAISSMEEKTFQSLIPQSEFVITLDEGEEVIWIADYVTRDDDVAYVTMQATSREIEGLEGELQITPSYQPFLFEWRAARNIITARALFGRPLFYALVIGHIRFDLWGRCTHVFPHMLYGSFSWRYDGYDGVCTSEKGEYYGEAIVDAYFEDRLKKWQPHIHVYAGWDWYDLGYKGGYLDWGD